MKLILLGPPGGGKGTQSELLIKKYNIPQISTGDLLRAAIREGTALGKKAKESMDKGHLVSDEIVVHIVGDRITNDDCKPGFILDGFPRTLSQASALETMLEDLKIKLDWVVNIEVGEELIIQRLSGRLTCRSCLQLYHTSFNPPKEVSKCDKCGGELFQRDDDNEVTVKKRLETFANVTSPLIQFYQKKGILKSVDGNSNTPQVVFDRIEKAFTEAQ